MALIQAKTCSTYTGYCGYWDEDNSYRKCLSADFRGRISHDYLFTNIISRELARSPHTDKKEKKIFLMYKEIQKGLGAKSYLTYGLLLIYGESPSSYMTL